MKQRNLFDPRKIIFREDTQATIRSATRKLYEVAKAGYGAAAGNVLIQKPMGAPLLSRDGVTNIKDIYLADQAEDAVAQVVKQTSQKSNEVVGDGTTAVVILAYHLLAEAQKRVGAGINPMVVSRQLEAAANVALEYVDSVSKEVTDDMLTKVATISAGDEAIGAMIADSIQAVGVDGGVIVEEVDALGIFNEIVDGFYFKKGFKDIRLINNYSRMTSEYRQVPILIAERRLTTIEDIAPVIDAVLENNIHQLVIIGDVEDDALQTLIVNKVKNGLDVTVVEPPVVGGERSLFLEDLAILTGGVPLQEGFTMKEFDIVNLGMAEHVVVKPYATTVVGADGDPEKIAVRIHEISKQLEGTRNDGDMRAMKNRLAALRGKVAILRVGGALDVERAEVKLRVDDAVCAVQAALRGGVVPGGATTLARITGTEFDEAFKKPFIDLVENTGANPSELLYKTLASELGMGFDLRDITKEPVNLKEAGIIDPTLVIREVIINATSLVARLITASAAIVFEDD